MRMGRDRSSGVTEAGRERVTPGMVKTKRVYELREESDGFRVLVMRLWPRGIRKEVVDVWLKELGADLALLRAWKAGAVDWPERKRRYLAGLGRPEAAAQLAQLEVLAHGRTVTLLCACKDERRCHRSLLRAVLERTSRRPQRRAAS